MSGGAQFRLAAGGLIDRSRPLSFRFNGRVYQGCAGDTLASALLANGIRLVGRSFKYHRPRGILAAGAEEPNALVDIGTGAGREPNVRATEIALYEGLEARSVNCWPNASFDLGGINSLLARFLPAAFYYKTFMWPSWHLYEWAIRRAAGLGHAPDGPDPDRYESRHVHGDLLVVGGGAAGLAAALAASAAGARVILAEQDERLGGRLLWAGAAIDGMDGAAWAADVEQRLMAAPETRLLTRTTAVGYFDHNSVSLVERLPEHAAAGRPRQRFWQVRAAKVILATGAVERPLLFAGNDRPGVMLSTAVRHYLNRFAVRCGERAVLFTNNDDAYATALDLVRSGVDVRALVDTRREIPPALAQQAEGAGIPIVPGGAVVATKGRAALSAVSVRAADGALSTYSADLLAMSGGFNPAVQLFCQSGGGLGYDAERAMFRPSRSVQEERSIGGAAGTLGLSDALAEANEAGAAAVGAPIPAAPVSDQHAPATEACWEAFGRDKQAYVDFQNDVTAADVALAARENFQSVEHLKRYTTLGMAPDQGKTSNVNGLALMARLTGRTIEETGTTRFRFPYTPVSFGALSGQQRGDLLKPLRRLPCHDWHGRAGAMFEEFGGWLRPVAYPQPGESRAGAEQREALAVRRGVGLFDASPLGKIEVVGPDAGLFLDRIYANRMSNIGAGKVRYGMMLNELGTIIDDGVVARAGEERFIVCTTGGGAARIADWMEEWLQCEWPDLDVLIAPVTTEWATTAIAGPGARSVIAAAGTDIPLGHDAFPHMAFREGKVAGIPARIYRVSFSGELAYEINVPARRALDLWQALLDAGEEDAIIPVGIDAWMLLRTEKGYLHVGADTDGTTTPADVGWAHVLKRPTDFVGRRSLTRPDAVRADRLQLVGLRALDGSALPAGVHLGTGDRRSQGYVTSSGYSPVLGRGVALGMVEGGRGRLGERLDILTGGSGSVEITDPCSYDPAGERLLV